MPKLTTRNAEIRTAAVEIKTLTVSGKQVTLAVFRQLPEQPLIATDGTLHGVPWGWVNYHPDPKLCPTTEHRHVVWQRGSELLRTAVTEEPADEANYPARTGSAWLNARIRDALAAGTDTGEIRKYDTITQDVAGVRVRIQVSAELKNALSAYEMLAGARQCLAEGGPDAKAHFYLTGNRGRSALTVISAPAAVRARWHEFDAAVERLGNEPIDNAYSRLTGEVQQELARRQRHVDARRAVADLPQLFIAV